MAELLKEVEDLFHALEFNKDPKRGIYDWGDYSEVTNSIKTKLISVIEDAENWRKFKDAIAYYEDDVPKTFEEYVHVTLKELVELREKFTKDGKCKE